MRRLEPMAAVRAPALSAPSVMAELVLLTADAKATCACVDSLEPSTENARPCKAASMVAVRTDAEAAAVALSLAMFGWTYRPANAALNWRCRNASSALRSARRLAVRRR